MKGSGYSENYFKVLTSSRTFCRFHFLPSTLLCVSDIFFFPPIICNLVLTFPLMLPSIKASNGVPYLMRISDFFFLILCKETEFTKGNVVGCETS